MIVSEIRWNPPEDSSLFDPLSEMTANKWIIQCFLLSFISILHSFIDPHARLAQMIPIRPDKNDKLTHHEAMIELVQQRKILRVKITLLPICVIDYLVPERSKKSLNGGNIASRKVYSYKIFQWRIYQHRKAVSSVVDGSGCWRILIQRRTERPADGGCALCNKRPQ